MFYCKKNIANFRRQTISKPNLWPYKSEKEELDQIVEVNNEESLINLLKGEPSKILTNKDEIIQEEEESYQDSVRHFRNPSVTKHPSLPKSNSKPESVNKRNTINTQCKRDSVMNESEIDNLEETIKLKYKGVKNIRKSEFNLMKNVVQHKGSFMNSEQSDDSNLSTEFAFGKPSRKPSGVYNSPGPRGNSPGNRGSNSPFTRRGMTSEETPVKTYKYWSKDDENAEKNSMISNETTSKKKDYAESGKKLEPIVKSKP